ncbi:glutamyl-tRNA reductase [Candidatus Spongiihabitans sp.]|uniref:glutamyl-tRNA reductase n=1 Tax=Candidatus Spongiihabitans sp. TaxID=3101308 RepID=UPI003C7C06FE
MLHILTLGLNHQTAPIEVREKAAFGPDSIHQALADLTQSAGVAEATILSTCNRTEIYCGQENADKTRILAWLSEYSGLNQRDLDKSIYHYPNEAAVKHAFRVASGLDSMVLGEPQILGQMKDAFLTASSIGATGKVLNRLFQHTFSVAKQVRTDTAIGANAVSVAYSGVNLAKRIFTRLSQQTVLLIGAGETIELVARHLKQNQVKHIIIANRSIDKAQTLARAAGGEAITEAISLAQIPERLHHADIVVTSTASTLPILGKGAIEAALKKRKHSPMFILDLAVPRDVEPEVSQLKDVYLYTVDDLKSMVDENREERLRATEQAENIIDFQVVKFMRWMRSLESVPAIKSFRAGLNDLKQAELQRALKKLGNGGDAEKVLEQLARDLTNKFAHQPSQVLKQADIDGNASIISAARKLFNL